MADHTESHQLNDRESTEAGGSFSAVFLTNYS